jgi:hypothetical protein
VKPKPPYCHITAYPMPIVSAPQAISLEGELPGVEVDLEALPGDAWWVLYEVASPHIGPHTGRAPAQRGGFPAMTTADVREELTGAATDARGMGRRWPGLKTSFDAEAQVIYVRFGAWLWSPATVEAYVRVAP